MQCTEKQKLLAAYSVAAMQHSDAVGALTTEVSLGNRETYERVWRKVRTARQDVIKARESLERHRKNHHC